MTGGKAAAALLLSVVALAGCNMRQDMAGPNSSESKRADNASTVEPIDRTPISSTPGAAPDHSTVEPRDPVTR